MMKLALALSVRGILLRAACGFQPSLPVSRHQYSLTASRMYRGSHLASARSDADADRMKDILAEETMNTANFAASAKQMQNMTPEGMDQMIREMDQMSPAQIEQLKTMGMDPNLMKQSMKMMRDNPSMMASVGKMMETMTPEQLLAQSRKAQEQLAAMTPEQVEQARKAAASLSPDQLEAATEIIADVIQTTPREQGLGSAVDPNVIDSMFRVAELMSQPPTGGVTFYAFSTLPPITVLSGTRDEDLSKKELAECWADGSLGATRVDRLGFERVWNEVQEYFEDDIMEAARKTALKSKSSSKAAVTAEIVPPTTPVTPVVGATLTPEQLSAMDKQVKSLSDTDMSSMLDQMSSMTPEQQARMKAMGVDPTMMEKTASMLKSNPMMRKAANAMMKNMTPEQMMKMSQQAQQQMANMSKEDYEKAMEKMKNGGI